MLVSPWRLWTQLENHHSHCFYQLVPVVILEHSRDPVCYTPFKAWGSLALAVGEAHIRFLAPVRSPLPWGSGTSQGEDLSHCKICISHPSQARLASHACSESHLLPLASPHLADSYTSCHVLLVTSPLLAHKVNSPFFGLPESTFIPHLFPEHLL